MAKLYDKIKKGLLLIFVCAKITLPIMKGE